MSEERRGLNKIDLKSAVLRKFTRYFDYATPENPINWSYWVSILLP